MPAVGVLRALRDLAPLLVLMASACGPTSLVPGIVRVDPLQRSLARESEFSIGVRTGPRVAQNLAQQAVHTFDPELGASTPPGLGAAIDAQFLKPIGDTGLAAHVGAQAEVLYAIPAPALGLMAGLSWLGRAGALSLAPALAVHAAADFGWASLSASATLIGGDASIAVAFHEGDVAAFGLAPFCSITDSISGGAQQLVVMPGFLAFLRFLHVELSFGLVRVFAEHGTWNAPLLGVRVLSR